VQDKNKKKIKIERNNNNMPSTHSSQQQLQQQQQQQQQHGNRLSRTTKPTASDAIGNASRQCRVPTDILDESDSKVLSQRYILLVQERYRAHKQSQELPFFLSRPKELLPLVLDNSQNSPAVAEHKRNQQERELRHWINLSSSAVELPNVVLRVAGLTSRENDDEEEEDDDMINLSRQDSYWQKKRAAEEELQQKESSSSSSTSSAKDHSASSSTGKDKDNEEDDDDDDEDYGKNYYESEDDEAGQE
jgi:hypothetical protein